MGIPIGNYMGWTIEGGQAVAVKSGGSTYQKTAHAGNYFVGLQNGGAMKQTIRGLLPNRDYEVTFAYVYIDTYSYCDVYVDGVRKKEYWNTWPHWQEGQVRFKASSNTAVVEFKHKDGTYYDGMCFFDSFYMRNAPPTPAPTPPTPPPTWAPSV